MENSGQQRITFRKKRIHLVFQIVASLCALLIVYDAFREWQEYKDPTHIYYSVMFPAMFILIFGLEIIRRNRFYLNASADHLTTRRWMKEIIINWDQIELVECFDISSEKMMVHTSDGEKVSILLGYLEDPNELKDFMQSKLPSEKIHFWYAPYMEHKDSEVHFHELMGQELPRIRSMKWGWLLPLTALLPICIMVRKWTYDLTGKLFFIFFITALVGITAATLWVYTLRLINYSIRVFEDGIEVTHRFRKVRFKWNDVVETFIALNYATLTVKGTGTINIYFYAFRNKCAVKRFIETEVPKDVITYRSWYKLEFEA